MSEDLDFLFCLPLLLELFEPCLEEDSLWSAGTLTTLRSPDLRLDLGDFLALLLSIAPRRPLLSSGDFDLDIDCLRLELGSFALADFWSLGLVD